MIVSRKLHSRKLRWMRNDFWLRGPATPRLVEMARLGTFADKFPERNPAGGHFLYTTIPVGVSDRALLMAATLQLCVTTSINVKNLRHGIHDAFGKKGTHCAGCIEG